MPTAAPPLPLMPASEFAECAGFRPFTIDEYHQMIRAGILLDGEPVELLEGWMIKKMSHGTPHDSVMDALEGALLPLLPADWFARCQRAVTLGNSEPEPDYAVVRGPRTRYRDAHPGPADIGLVVEVSDSSLRIDRVGKGRIYARAGIPVYWVVNVPDKQVEVYTQPAGADESAAYGQYDTYAVGTAAPVALGGTTVGTIAVADVLG
ncbi:MAG: Uma2 family endonuclease [Gemmataceae bacterium]|nr:Uma2 family endonuclease [Gemmataceae bacterium]